MGASVDDGTRTDTTEFTDVVGSGSWQVRILLIMIVASIPAPMNHMIGSFFAVPQDYWCSKPSYVTSSKYEWKMELSNRTSDKCETFENVTETRTKVPCEDWDYDPSYVTITKQWNLVCNKEWMSSMSQSVYMGGFFVATPVFGQLSDMYGRHSIMMYSLLISIVCGIISTFSSSFLIFTIMRFFVGLGQSAFSLVVYVLGIETIGPAHRANFCYIMNFGWNIGYCALPLVAYLFPHWSELQLAVTVPCIPLIALYWLLPESPRWLLANGKVKEATCLLQKAAKCNGRKVPDLEIQIKKLCRSAELNKEETANKKTVFDLLKTPNLRKKTLNIFFNWFVISFVYYGLSLNTGQLGGDIYLNFFLSGLVEVPGTFLCMALTERCGRKRLYILTLLSSGVACVICAFIPDNYYWLLVSFNMTGKMMISCSFSVIYLYTAELLPTTVRNAGLGSSSMIARIASIIAPYMKDLGNVTDPIVPMALFGILSILGGMLVCFLPETRGYQVPETLDEAENFTNSKKCENKNLEMLAVKTMKLGND